MLTPLAEHNGQWSKSFRLDFWKLTRGLKRGHSGYSIWYKGQCMSSGLCDSEEACWLEIMNYMTGHGRGMENAE